MEIWIYVKFILSECFDNALISAHAYECWQMEEMHPGYFFTTKVNIFV